MSAVDRAVVEDLVRRHFRGLDEETGDSSGAYARTQHYVANMLVDVHDDVVSGRGNLVAIHVHDSASPDRHFDLGGVIRFEARRIGGDWHLDRLGLEVVWRGGGGRAPSFLS